MNKRLFFIIVSAFLCRPAVAQKPLISMNGETWETYGKDQISNNGGYIACDIQGGTTGLCIRSTQSAWQIRVPRAGLVIFSQDSRKVIFRLGDSLGIMDLDGENKVEWLKAIATYRVVNRGRDQDLLIYRSKDRPDQLVIRELESGEERSYAGVESYWTSDDGNAVVLEIPGKEGSRAGYVLNWLDISKGEVRTIWEGRKVEDLKIGYHNEQCAFMTGTVADTDNSIWICRYADGKAAKVLDGQSGLLKGMVIKNMIDFNDVSGRIFLNLGQPQIHQTVPAGAVSVDVWSYKDAELQSMQLAGLKRQQQRNSTPNYEAVLNIEDRQLIRLEYENEHISGNAMVYDDKAMHYLLLMKSGGGDGHEWNWNSSSRTGVYLIDLDNGKRRLISGERGADAQYYILSCNEQYVFYYDPIVNDYCSYRIGDGRRQNMTAGVHALYKSEGMGNQQFISSHTYIAAGLIKNSNALLVYDQHDVFKLDPASQMPAVNLTGAAGHPKDWVFRLTNDNIYTIIDSKDRLCLRVVNEADKASCLTSISIDSTSVLPPLHFAPYWLDCRPWEKARDKDVYTVERMSAEEHPNLFFTRDFKTYNAITDIHPEKAYNWMTSELVTWKTFDGGFCQGVLYKPENFDPHRKYPLLIYYYEQMSGNLHQFISPEVSDGELNIPYYVSHGYLVFTPDIHYRIGWPGRSSYNCVVSGAEYLARRPYVDGKRMGLQGHSFGGFETNYIITHTTLFAAAMSASGISDIISDYNSIRAQFGASCQDIYEVGQSRIGSTLWKRSELYFENSAVLRADKITTPLLIMANKGDDIVSCQQGIELFTALRRLGKKAWMLQYDGEGHGVSTRKAQEDLTLRMAQFFNYYLKGEPPPKWMTIGIPASLKGIDPGLDIDNSGTKP